MLNKIKKPFLVLINLFKGIVSEVKQVDFLSRSATLRYTAFIAISLVLGTLFLILADRGLFAIRNLILNF